jgi:glycosyltransferase 2 family protein
MATAPLPASPATLATRSPQWGRRRIYQAIFGIGALLLVMRRVSGTELWENLRQLTLFTIFSVVFLNLLTTYLMAVRWQWLLSVKYRLSSHLLLRQYLIGQFFNLFAPGALGGDAARVLMLGKQVNDRSFVFATVVMERIVGLLGVLLSGFISLYLANSHFHYPGSSVLVATLFLIIITTTLLLINYGETLFERLIHWKLLHRQLPYLPQWSQNLFPPLFAAFRHFRGCYLLLFSTMLWTILVRLCWAAIFWLLALSLALPISFFLLFTLLSIVDIARMLPLVPPNGLGVREYLFVVLFGAAGLSASQALLLCLIGYNLLFINSLIGYPLYLMRASFSTTDPLQDQTAPLKEN